MPSIDLHSLLGNLALSDIVAALLTLVVCLIIIRVVIKLLRKLLVKSRLDARVQKYLVGGIKTVLYLITILIVITNLGIDTTSLVALLSVVSLGITLAAEDILANMAGGLVILSARPFNIGDYIEASGTAGNVKEISLNYTKLITPDGLLVMLPNKALADSQMINYTALGRRRVCQKVTASYDAPTATVKQACQAALDMTENILTDPAPVIRLTNYGNSSIEYAVYCWASTDDYWTVHYALGENLRTAFERSGVEMTYDHLNVHIVENRG